MDSDDKHHRDTRRRSVYAAGQPKSQRRFAGLVAMVAIAVALLALMWPNSTTHEQRTTTAMSERR